MKKFLLFLFVGVCTLSYLYLAQARIILNQDELTATRSSAEIQQLRYSLAQIKDNIMQTAEERKSYLLDEQKLQDYIHHSEVN